LKEFIDVLEIKPFLKRQPKKLSLGERMRCELAASLIHNPPIVFLDEPTIGLNIVAAKRIREFINERNKEDGTTLFPISNQLEVKTYHPQTDFFIYLMSRVRFSKSIEKSRSEPNDDWILGISRIQLLQISSDDKKLTRQLNSSVFSFSFVKLRIRKFSTIILETG